MRKVHPSAEKRQKEIDYAHLGKTDFNKFRKQYNSTLQTDAIKEKESIESFTNIC